MSENRIDLAEARELLAMAVETQGRDFVYQTEYGDSCFNVPVTDANALQLRRGRPLEADSPKRKTGCLVGVAMKLSGRIENWDERDSEGKEIYWSGPVVKAFGHLLTPEAAKYFLVAQQAQDCGTSWGRAFDAAETYADPLRAGG